ncbi:MAG TPA: hypothetical protein VKE41_15290 [Roseiflexaceae bacterium]|nr:hypothetical protein [Roseiflexaceae bacterium]
MLKQLWRRSIVLALLLVALCCPARASHATSGIFTRPASLGDDRSVIQELSSLAGNVTCVQVVGARVYAGGPDGLLIADVSNLAAPSQLGSYPGAVIALHVVGSIAHLAGPDGLRIVDVTDAAHPVLRSSYYLPLRGETFSQSASRVQVVGNDAFVIFQQTVAGIPPYRSELAIVDVRDQSNPALRERVDLGPSFNDLALVDGYAYIGGTTDVGGATGRFFSAYLSVLDVRDPAHPTPVGRYQSAEVLAQNSTGALAVADDVAYLGLTNGPALYTLDVRNRNNPTLLGSLPPSAGPAFTAKDLRVADQFAYVAGSPVGLAILDIRNPAAPALRTSTNLPGTSYAVDVAGDIMYVAAGDAGLRLARFIPRTAAAIPTGGGTLEATVGRVAYHIPPGAFADTVAMTHTLRIANDLPPAPMLTRIGLAFEITASYSATGQLAQPTLPITIAVRYTDSERVPATAGSPALYYLDSGVWAKQTTSTLDQTGRTVTATSPRLGIWALMGEAKRALLPAMRR